MCVMGDVLCTHSGGKSDNVREEVLKEEGDGCNAHLHQKARQKHPPEVMF